MRDGSAWIVSDTALKYYGDFHLKVCVLLLSRSRFKSLTRCSLFNLLKTGSKPNLELATTFCNYESALMILAEAYLKAFLNWGSFLLVPLAKNGATDGSALTLIISFSLTSIKAFLLAVSYS